MTKKDYISIANDLRIERAILARSENGANLVHGFDVAVQTLCGAFKRDNSAFDKARFLTAVGVHDGRIYSYTPFP